MFPDDHLPCFNCSVNIMAAVSKPRGQPSEGNTVYFRILFPDFHLFGFIFHLEIVKSSLFSEGQKPCLPALHNSHVTNL